MLNNVAIEDKPDWVSPPGDTILSILEEQELTVEQFAIKIEKSIIQAQKILDGRFAINADLARRLANSLGPSESFWTARESDYRACIEPQEEVNIISLTDFINKLPVSDMQKFGWIKKAQSKNEKIANCLAFFGVSSLAQWHGRFGDTVQEAIYRRSIAHTSCDIATTAWLRKGEIDTQHDQVKDWSPENLKKQIDRIRSLTWYKNPALFLPKLKNIFGEAGVKLAIVRTPKGCSTSGAVRILQNGVPHIQLSFRYLSDDQFWFTLFHEIAHLLLHYDKMPIIESADLMKNEYEKEANEFASHVIVPMPYREELLSLGSSRFPIIKFAKKVGIAPGLIVGQLQYEKIIGYNQMQHLKRRFQWTD